MNRREFIQTSAAATAAPLIPLPAAVKVAAARPIDVMWGEAIVRAQNNGSVSLLAKSLKIPAEAAAAVQKELLAKNVIRAGAMPGSTVAVQPTFTGSHMVKTAQKTSQVLNTVKDKTKEVLEDIKSPDFASDNQDDPTDDCSEHLPEHPPQQ